VKNLPATKIALCVIAFVTLIPLGAVGLVALLDWIGSLFSDLPIEARIAGTFGVLLGGVLFICLVADVIRTLRSRQ
jgi:hypothetical protein